MKNYKKHIDAFFREKAGRGPETPPSHIWDNLDKQLDDLPPAKAPASYRWFGYFAILSVLLLLSVPALRKMGIYPPAPSGAAVTGNTQNSVSPSAAIASAQKPGTTTPAQSSATQSATGAANTAQNATNTSATCSNATDNPQPSATNAVAVKTNSSKTYTPANTTNPHKKTKGSSNADAYANNPIKPNITPRVKHSRYTNPVAANTPGAKTNKTKDQKHTGPAAPVSEHNYAAAANDQNLPAGNALPSSPGNAAGPNPGNDITATTTATQNQKPPLANKPKQPGPPAAKKEIAKKPEEKKHKKATPPDQRWEGGVKVGYEIGFNNSAASKYVISPFLQYNITSKLSLLAQPAAKYAQLTAHSVGNDATYYQVNDDGVVAPVSGSSTNYTYTVSHDSIIKSYTYRGSYMEFELPILIKYYITKRASVFGGINLLYSMPPGITENTYTKSYIRETINFSSPTPDPVPPDVAYTGTPYTAYSGPLYQPSTAGRFHIGYMAGFSYEVGRKWLFDALIEQGSAPTNVVGGYNVNAPLSQMYLRLSAGYKFKKSAKKNNPFGHQDTGRGD